MPERAGWDARKHQQQMKSHWLNIFECSAECAILCVSCHVVVVVNVVFVYNIIGKCLREHSFIVNGCMHVICLWWPVVRPPQNTSFHSFRFYNIFSYFILVIESVLGCHQIFAYVCSIVTYDIWDVNIFVYLHSDFFFLCALKMDVNQCCSMLALQVYLILFLSGAHNPPSPHSGMVFRRRKRKNSTWKLEQTDDRIRNFETQRFAVRLMRQAELGTIETVLYGFNAQHRKHTDRHTYFQRKQTEHTAPNDVCVYLFCRFVYHHHVQQSPGSILTMCLPISESITTICRMEINSNCFTTPPQPPCPQLDEYWRILWIEMVPFINELEPHRMEKLGKSD